jgi:GxxExxY protein
MKRFDVDNLSSLVIRAAINVHKVFGPGLLESIYQSSMVIELGLMGIEVLTEVPLHVSYKGRKIPNVGLRLDLLVEDTIIVEAKVRRGDSASPQEAIIDVPEIGRKTHRLLINFNTTLLREGITRVISSPQGDGNAPRFR